MNTKTRLTLENADDSLTARLEYTLGNGESIVMTMQLPVTSQGAPSRQIQEVEAAVLERTKMICEHMLRTIHKEP